MQNTNNNKNKFKKIIKSRHLFSLVVFLLKFIMFIHVVLFVFYFTVTGFFLFAYMYLNQNAYWIHFYETWKH